FDYDELEDFELRNYTDYAEDINISDNADYAGDIDISDNTAFAEEFMSNNPYFDELEDLDLSKYVGHAEDINISDNTNYAEDIGISDDTAFAEESISNDPLINEFIRNDDRLRWIPYEKLTNIEHIANGGFGVVSKAKWKSKEVILKSLNNSQHITADILEEIIHHQRFDHLVNIIYVVQCYGISQDPTNGNYLMVMHYFNCGICNGLRPNLDIVGIPQLLKALIIECWDDNPLLRPKADHLLDHFKTWYTNIGWNPEFCKQNKAAQELLTSNNPTYQTHPQAIYTSRLLDLYLSEKFSGLDITNNV
ncbi:4780_t:CDS:2, partial [Gigaspora margarita]